MTDRRLTRPPSERYRTPPAGEPAAPPTGSSTRAVAAGAVVATGGAAALVALGALLALSAGLVVLAAAIGWAVAAGVRAGGRGSLTPGLRVVVAVVFALDAVVLGHVGLWLVALAEGGVLGPLEHLAQTYGVLVPLELAAAAGVAWWTAR